MAKDNKEKYLIVVVGSDLVRKFEGNILEEKKEDELIIKICYLKSPYSQSVARNISLA